MIAGEKRKEGARRKGRGGERKGGGKERVAGERRERTRMEGQEMGLKKKRRMVGENCRGEVEGGI